MRPIASTRPRRSRSSCTFASLLVCIAAAALWVRNRHSTEIGGWQRASSYYICAASRGQFAFFRKHRAGYFIQGDEPYQRILIAIDLTQLASAAGG
jgi:hypothetical protein